MARRTVFDAVLEQQLSSLLAGFPERSHAAPRRLAAEVCQLFVGLGQDLVLLLDRQPHRVLVRIAVQASVGSFLHQFICAPLSGRVLFFCRVEVASQIHTFRVLHPEPSCIPPEMSRESGRG